MRISGCHCLCGVNHPEDFGVCTIEATTSREYLIDGTHVAVPMCAACAAAVDRAEAERRARA